MNVLMLNYEYPPLGGGAGNATFYLLKEFSRYGDVNIELITSSAGDYREEAFSRNIRIYFLEIEKSSNLHYQTNRELLTYAYKSYKFCKNLLSRRSYHLCHAFFGIPCGFIAMKLKTPYLVSLRGSDVPFYNQRFYYFDTLFFKYMSRTIWKRAASVIANSDDLKKLALRTSPSQDIDVIANGVDVDQFRPARTESKTLRLLCVSRLIKRKGIDCLLRAIGILGEYDIRLVVVGDGDQKLSLIKLTRDLGISSKVEFRGYVPHREIDRVYRESDLFISPSFNEGMNNSVLESMSCGLPVITTDTGGAGGLIDGNGFIIHKGDHEGLARQILDFIKNRDMIQKMGDRSREIALEMSWGKVADAYYKIYNTIYGDVSRL
ncbi:MAG: glycosyltransferase family 4 protein [Candidatus Omnitrophica bacterium]|nr:glycosyltransferase family 4 protein [Candidatus Omnitrophota bacterium]